MPLPGRLTRVPLYEQAAQTLREAVDRGGFPAGRLPTEKELSGRLGISPMTVRKALAKLIDEGLIVRRQGSGTFLREMAAHPPYGSRRRTHLLCYVSATGTESTPDNFFNRLMHSCRAEAERLGYSPVIASAREDALPLPLAGRKVDGILLAGTVRPGDLGADPVARVAETNNRYAFRLVKAGIPIVAISNYASCPAVHCVVPDYEKGLAEALSDLARLGHRRIGFCGGPLYWPPFSARLAALKRLAARRKLVLEERHVAGYERPAYQDPEAAAAAVRGILEGPRRPTALVVGSGPARVVTQAVLEADLSIPGDLSVVFFTTLDRPAPAEPLHPDEDERITSDMAVVQSLADDMAGAALDRVVKLIEGHTFSRGERIVRTPVSYLTGSTVGPAPT